MSWFSGADAEGLLWLGASLGRAAQVLHEERVAIAAALDGTGVDTEVTRTLLALETWCQQRRDDAVRRAVALTGLDGGGGMFDAVAVITGLRRVAGVSARLVGPFGRLDAMLGPLGAAANLHALVDPGHGGWRGLLDRVVAAGALSADAAIVGAVAGSAPVWAEPVAAGAAAYGIGSVLYDDRDPIGELASTAAGEADEVLGAVTGAAEAAEEATACAPVPVLLEPMLPVIGPVLEAPVVCVPSPGEIVDRLLHALG